MNEQTPTHLSLELNHADKLTERQAKLLVGLDKMARRFNATKRSALDLSCLKAISPAVAKELAKLPDVSLPALTSLSSASASNLGSVRFWLNLEGLKSISPGVARHLSKATAAICLDGLESLSLSVAKALSAHGGRFTSLGLSGVKEMSAAAAKALATHRGCLRLDNLNIPDPTLAAAFGTPNRKCCCLSVGLFDHEDLRVAEFLASGRGNLSASVAKITPPLIEIFRKRPDSTVLTVGRGVGQRKKKQARYFFDAGTVSIDPST